MIIRKTMISVVAAAAIISSFTGCGDDDNNTVRTSDNNSTVNNVASDSNRISNAKGSVTGTVMDTNGNPIEGVSVSLAGQRTDTDAAGIYLFNNVPVTNTANGVSNTAQALSVTISAPEGYLGATVTVTPQAQQISSEDNNNNNTTGQTNPNTNFIDGYLASAGTAVLPKLGANVTGRLELTNSEASVANQEISLDFVNVGGNIAQPQNGVATTWAVKTGYRVMTDANGIFKFTNLPMDSRMFYVVPNYTIAGIQGTGLVGLSTAAETSFQNVGDLQVVPVVQSDTAAPYVTSVTGTIGNTGSPQMMEDDIRKTFVINFSEAMNIESDEDYTNSVIVKAGLTRAKMTSVTATATIGSNGTSIIVELDKELPDASLLDINLLITDFKDAAGNFLRITTPALNPIDDIGYDSAGVNGANGQVVALQLQIFNDLNTNAPQVTTISQETLDTNGMNDAEILQAANSAFNDVIDSGTPDDVISNMNSRDDNEIAGQRLATLGTDALGRAVTVESDVARVNFTPSNAATYTLSLTRAGATRNIQGSVIVQGGTDTGTFTNVGVTDVTFTPVDVTDATPVQLVLTTGINARPGDILTFTPRDELGYVGTPNAIILRDNVEPTTVLQNSYGLGNNSNSSNTVVKFGNGGELSDTSGAVTAGTPYLAITAGLLDNLNAAGTAVTGMVASDNTLLKELNEFNKAFDHDSDTTTPNTKLIGVYDTTAYTTMVSKASRKIGVAFSEDVDLNGTTPVVTSISTALSAWTNNNDVVRNDNGAPVNVDLIDFTTANVIALANDDNLGVIDFTGVVDNAGNAATSAANAKVVLLDRMPPFVTKASFDGTNVSVTFNEAVKLVNGATLIVNGITASYLSANSANYVVSADKKTLTIAVAEFTGLTRANFTLGSYAETAYGSDKREHASLSWTVEDVHGNEWTNESAGVTAPVFAIADLIGDFQVTTNNSGYKFATDTTTVDQIVIWTFNQPLQTGGGTDLVTTPAGITSIVGEMEAVIAGAADILTKADLTLSADKKTLKLVFKTTTDATAQFDGLRIKASSTKTLTSAVDTTQSETISANAN